MAGVETNFKYRFFIVFLLALGTFFFMSQRISFSTNLLCMNKDARFNYSVKDKSDLQSYFFVGYSIGQIPLGFIFQRLGIKYTVPVLFFLLSATTLIAPVVGQTSLEGFFALRFFSGLTSSCWFPSVFNVLPKWIPPYELNIVQAFVFSGLNIGAITAPFITYQLCETEYSWKTPYVVYGICGMIYSFIYLALMSDTPLKSRFIGEREKSYLTDQIPMLVVKKKKRISIKNFLTCMPLWAAGICHFCSDWGSYLMFTSAANYLEDFFNYSTKWNSIIQGLAMVGVWGGQLFFTLLTALLIKKTKLKLITIRKLMTFMGFLIPPVLFIILCFLKRDQGTLAVICLTVISFFYSAAYVGPFMTILDCTPSNSGEIYAVMNSLSAIGGYLGPMILGRLVEKHGDNGWRITFIITAILIGSSGLFFLLVGKAEIQHWENTSEDEKEKDKLMFEKDSIHE